MYQRPTRKSELHVGARLGLLHVGSIYGSWVEALEALEALDDGSHHANVFGLATPDTFS